jgi:RNA-dependent RNA polymerase
VITSVKNAVRSTSTAASLLDQYGLGTAFRVSSVLQSLQKLGLTGIPKEEFVTRGLTYAVNDVLRSLKHKARISVPDSYTLVGVADVHGYLREGEIFGSLYRSVFIAYRIADIFISTACIRYPHQEPFYLEGDVLITRSPAIHPGDVQMVRAIGVPPANSPFAHEKLPNCVVFATRGE